MSYPVRFSPMAVSDLERVWSEVYAASRDEKIAEKYVEDLLDNIEMKAAFPKTGAPLYYENRFTGYYYVSFKAYMAFYHLEDNVLYVDRVLFGKCDYLRVLHISTEE